jgi:hypothetical protein
MSKERKTGNPDISSKSREKKSFKTVQNKSTEDKSKKHSTIDIDQKSGDDDDYEEIENPKETLNAISKLPLYQQLKRVNVEDWRNIPS